MLRCSIVAIALSIAVSSFAAADDPATKKPACTKACAQECADACKNSAGTGTTVTAKATNCGDALCNSKQAATGADSKQGNTCEVTATLQGEFVGATDNSLRLMIVVPNKGAPILSQLPHVKRLFKNAGNASHSKVVVQIPRNQVKTISKEKGVDNNGLDKVKRWAKIVIANASNDSSATNSGSCAKANACQADSCQSNACQSTSTGVAAEKTKSAACSDCPALQAVQPSPTAPRNQPVSPPPAWVAEFPALPPSPYYAHFLPPPPTCPITVSSRPGGCASGRAGAAEQHERNEQLMQQLHVLSAENARLRARAAARDEAIEQQEALRHELMKAHVECVRLQAVEEQREELLSDIVETSVENARLSAQLEFVEQREQLVAEVVALQRLKDARVENESLKARIAELEAKVKEISERVARQPATIVR